MLSLAIPTPNNPHTQTIPRVSRWLDQRNQSRIAQFEANRAALLASSTTTTTSSSSSSSSSATTPAAAMGVGGEPASGVGGGGSEEEEKEIDPKSKTFGTTAEFAGLAGRLLHVGMGQV